MFYNPTVAKSMTKRQLAKACRVAAKAIEKQPVLPRGASWEDVKGFGICHCVGSALGCAVVGKESARFSGGMYVFSTSFPLEAVNAVFGNDTFAIWNDTNPEANPKTAAQKLRQLAYALEHGGKLRPKKAANGG